MDTKLTILHLEDDESSAKLIHHDLKKEGIPFDVPLVAVGQSFWDALHGAAFHLILADYTNKELAAISHSVSHDLRSPLQPILGFPRLLPEEPVINSSESVRDMTLQIGKAGDWMNPMILGPLEFSQPGRQELLMEECSLEAVWKEVVREFEPELREVRIGSQKLADKWQISFG